MQRPGRVQAAIEVLEDIVAHHRPASVALADWGRTHRFAGSGDRAAIGNLVYDALRERSASAWMMGTETPRALVIGALARVWDLNKADLTDIFSGDRHAPDPLSDDERNRLESANEETWPGHVRANVPEWLWPVFTAAFDAEAVDEGKALSRRAPLDLRTNTLSATRDKILKSLARYNATAGPITPTGIRISPPNFGDRTPNVQSEAGFQRGHFEVQDEGSQVVAGLTMAQPGEQVLDLCAGAGGKTLALAAAMQNKGQVFAYDSDRQRLAPIYARLKRAGVRNVQVRAPDESLDDLKGRMHRVVIDAPCSGSGVWRRRPDAKWRLTSEALQKRLVEQREILEEAAKYVRPGGYLCYITCSVLSDENEAQVLAFLEGNPEFELISCEEAWRDLYGFDKPSPWSSDAMTLTLTPAATGTDGFFFAVLERRGGGE